MERFVFRFFCVFYLAMVVNTRTINNSKNIGDIFGINGDKEKINDVKQLMKDEIEDQATTEIDKILESVTEKIDNLKDVYGGEKFKALLPKLEQIIYEYPRKTTSKTTVTEDLDFIGTAQIEALLNDIKARAIQMVAEQNPSVTDMITNTVTEATFEADPILTHLEITSPGYALTTFVCLNNIENIDKRTANESNYVVVSGEDSKHSITVRSVKESAYTIAHSVEDLLQKELKCIYKKVKQKVSKDFHKEIKAAKSTLEHHSSRVTDKITKLQPKNSHLTTLRRTTKTRQNRGNKETKTTTTKVEDTTVTPTIDDFAMLTLYEQILAKTHEDNVMKMLATNKKRKIDETVRLSKRNPETLADLTLKKDIKNMIDDGDNIPDIDYNNDIKAPQSNNDYPSNPIPAKKLDDQANTDSTPIEDTSYEGLSDKLAYKDYVNGFKNYLKFQRDEAKENFSALIKYQAHKHHNVDDIGKFILNKIPQIPNRRRRHFFDENDIDDQDISTKSDDSWFKKHFYMFIDNGPPKKFHTSETVEFRDVTEANKIDYPDVIEKPDSHVYRNYKTNKDTFHNINLDELSRLLEDRKKFTSYSPYFNDESIISSPETKINDVEESGIRFRVNAPNIISKLFRKRQKGPDLDNKSTHETESHKDHTLKYDDEGQGEDEDNFLFNTGLTRFQRSVVKEKSEEESNENHTTFLNKQRTKTDIAKNSDEKVGCVSIVTQPTAIVSLHKSNAKVSRVQRLLSKLHFRRKKTNHKKKKEKRHCTRVQRFNLLRKLKNMFTPKQNAKNLALNEDTDYEMIKAHIDTFKPVKYYKIPSLDELKNQVPNITGDMEIQFEMVKDDDEWTAKDDTTKINKVATENTKVATKQYTLPSVNTQKSKTQHTTKLKNKPKMKEIILPTDDIMNVNVKTFSKMGDVFAVSPVTVDDMKQELDKLQMKMFTETNPRDSQSSPKGVVRLTEPRREGREDLNEDEKETDDDITIKAKLTRLAKYPIPKLKNNSKNVKPLGIGDISKLYEFSDNESYLNVHKKSLPFAVTEKTATPYQHYNKLKKYDITMDAITATTLKILDDEKLKEWVGSHRTYPDYFHDLVRWNNDILNNDKVSNPTWQDILNNIQGEQQYTTPDVHWISKELSDIKENLNHYDIGRMDGKQTKIAEIDPALRNDIVTGIGSFMKNPKYVPKAKDVKLQVGNSKNNKQTIGKSDEDSKNDPKSYSNYKTQDIINVLNELYNKYSSGIKKGNTKCKNNEGTPVHTNSSNTAVQAMFAPHEDKLYFMANSSSWVPKKISKNSLTVPTPKQKQTKPIAHVNEMPKQFYNTPLPMRNENFEQFLKDNKLDVETLTLPLTNMPAPTETWHSKIHSLTQIMNTNNLTDETKENSKITESIQTTTKSYQDNINDIAYKLYPESQIEYLNDLEKDLMDDNDGNVRNKRYNVQDYNSYTDNSLIGTEKIRDLKSKFSNLFDKKPEEKKSVVVDSVTDDSDDDLEITIINFEDLGNKTTNQEIVTNPSSHVFAKVNFTTKNLDKIDAISTTKAKTSKTKKNKEKQHKTSYSFLKADGTNMYDSTEMETEKQHQTQTTLKADEKGAYTDPLLTKIPYLQEVTTMAHAKLPNVLKNKDKHPKRVRISSHSYSYDVVYHVPNKNDRGDIVRDEHDILNPSLAKTKISRNSEYGVTDPRLRAVRSAKTTSKRRTFSQSIHFTKEMKKSRDRRLFKILPIFKDKIKNLAKMKSFTALIQRNANKTAKSLLNLNATDLTTTAPAGTNATKRSERNSLSYNFDDMFDLKVFTVNDKRNAGTENNVPTTNLYTSKGRYTSFNNKTSDYIEGRTNYDVVYYELETWKPPKNITNFIIKRPIESPNQEVNKLKRNVDSGFYTAKDVAEFEVIVDLIRNTLRYAEKSPNKMTTLHNLWSVKRSKTNNKLKANMDHTTNFIQVHIAVPYDISNKKRNSDPAKVRKVFTAKLASPVDLEYQIHSIEDNTATTVNPAHYGLSPGTYLIVDDNNKNYTFKSVEMPSLQMNEDIDAGEQAVDETKSNKMELSREEFIAAVHKYLTELYENVTSNTNRNNVDRRTRDTSWDRIKKYFGHDRVCKCKCKANKPMCKSCAACDPVIKELILEFDNLAKYMSDHCTEIQTFFWMNPSGGRALRDAVHKIDRSLNDYYKRVKGKCNGSKCKTFATYIDKRGSKNNKVNKNYIGEPLLNDIKSLKDHFELAKFIPYDETLREIGDEFVNTVSNCIDTKSQVKRRKGNKRKCYNKDVYTLENISVNIICTTDTQHDSTTRPVSTNSYFIARMAADNKNELRDVDLNKANLKRYKTELDKQIEPMRQKLIKYDTENEVNILKREAKSNQIESPLIADTGGLFWREYLNKGNAEQNNEYKSDVELSDVQTAEKTPATITTKLAFKDKLKNIRRSKIKSDITTNTPVTDISMDSFSYNINELFKLINTMRYDTENQFAITTPTTLMHRNYTTRTKKIKTKKNKKLYKTGKAKMHRMHKTKTLKTKANTNHNASHDKTKSKELSTILVPKKEKSYASNNIEDTTTLYKDTVNLTSEKNTLKSTTTKINLFDKIKKATIGFRSYIGYGAHDTLAEKDEKRINTNTKDDKKTKSGTNVISAPTTKLNPTILIINDDNTNRDVKDKSKIKSFFLSLLNYESSKIDKEKGRLKDEIEKEITDAEAIQQFSHGNEDDMEHIQPKKSPELDYMLSVQGTEPVLAPPGRQRPGLLERVARKLGVSAANDKVAATSTRHLKRKHHHHHAKTRPRSKTITEETDPTKSMKLQSNDPNPRSKESQTGSDNSTSSETKQNMNKDIDGILRTVGKSKNMNKISEFDNYVRDDNGIYRLRKKRNQNEYTNAVTEKHGGGFQITQNYRNEKFRHRKKRKRSNSEIKNSQRLSAWLQHSAGYYVATITSFYIVLATFAAVVNWVFGR